MKGIDIQSFGWYPNDFSISNDLIYFTVRVKWIQKKACFVA